MNEKKIEKINSLKQKLERLMVRFDLKKYNEKYEEEIVQLMNKADLHFKNKEFNETEKLYYDTRRLIIKILISNMKQICAEENIDLSLDKKQKSLIIFTFLIASLLLSVFLIQILIRTELMFFLFIILMISSIFLLFLAIFYFSKHSPLNKLGVKI